MVEQHRKFLDDGYKKNFFIASGPRNPRIGGVIISQLACRALLEGYMKNDPFAIHHIAEYEIIEFTPNKYQEVFSAFL